MNNKILNIWNRYKLYFIFFIVFSPIFISLDFSNGLKFDGCIGNLYNRPSIPIAFFLLGLVSIINIKQLLNNRKLILLFLFTGVYMILNLYYGTSRALIVGLGMFLPLISFYTFKILFNQNMDIYKIMYLTLFTIIVIKFAFDLYRIYIDCSNIDVTIRNIFYGIFNTSYYVIDSIRIYNYYDYFSFIYYVAVSLSFYNIINNTMIKKSILLVIVSLLAALSTGSRLFIYGIYLIPILYIIFKITKFKLETYFYFFMVLSVSITVIISTVDFNLESISLSTRNNLAYAYFNDFHFINLLLPFTVQHRIETLGSFHNELLEIFSFFGFTMIYYYYLIMQMFSKVQKKYKLISFFLIFIIIIGSLIQINISNPYVGIILGMILAVLSLNDNNTNKKYNNTYATK